MELGVIRRHVIRRIRCNQARRVRCRLRARSGRELRRMFGECIRLAIDGSTLGHEIGKQGLLLRRVTAILADLAQVDWRRCEYIGRDRTRSRV